MAMVHQKVSKVDNYNCLIVFKNYLSSDMIQWKTCFKYINEYKFINKKYVCEHVIILNTKHTICFCFKVVITNKMNKLFFI